MFCVYVLFIILFCVWVCLPYLCETLGCDWAAWLGVLDADRIMELWWQQGWCCCWLNRGCCSDVDMEGTDCSLSTLKTPVNTETVTLKLFALQHVYLHSLNHVTNKLATFGEMAKATLRLNYSPVGSSWMGLNWRPRVCLERSQMKYHHLTNDVKTAVKPPWNCMSSVNLWLGPFLMTPFIQKFYILITVKMMACCTARWLPPLKCYLQLRALLFLYIKPFLHLISKTFEGIIKGRMKNHFISVAVTAQCCRSWEWELCLT